MSSEPASPSSIISDEERSTLTIADSVKNYNTNELTKYLQKKDLKLDDDDFAILRNLKITGRAFLELTEERLERYGFKIGPAITITSFIKELKEQKMRNFSSYKTVDELKEILHKYKVHGEDIINIKQFNPVFEEIDDHDQAFKRCMHEITLRLTNLETVTNVNEATRNVFITSILNASIAIARRLSHKEKIYISYQKDISGDEAYGLVDYAIKGKEDLMCIIEGKSLDVKLGYLQNIVQLESAYQTNKKKRIAADHTFRDNDYDYLYGIVTTAVEWHFIMFTTDGLYCTSKKQYQINLTKMVIEEDFDAFRNSLKRVIGIIVGLLRDRVSVDNSPSSKWARINEFKEK
ncbi:hypothetical protein Glove_299g95 [Diversispora epigaea]|uniref:SAM domain-containing protein n=1 Tax=Diversispora epigaea TaxID=1348612 RepID=A0A397I0Q0_9GLOM|nr:hypothetical protein Glove_299g95 [Diversispora epigaea]